MQTRKIADLKPYENNARTHSPEQITEIGQSITEFGFNNPILIDASNNIIAGHGRLLAAKELGMIAVPVHIVDHLSPTQQRAYILADNRIALNAGWSPELLKTEFEALLADDFEIGLTGFTQDEIDAFLNPEVLSEGQCDPDDVPEVPEVPVTVLGDVWILGNHRLMCGDSTMIDQVDRLMDGAKADMVFTDPPYNIAEKTKGIASSAPTNKQNKKLMESEWDRDFKFDRLHISLLDSMNKDCAIYICAIHFTAPDIWKWMSENADFYGYCVWSKPNPFPSLMKKHWAFSSELICYGTRGKPVFNYPDHGNALSVWEIAIGEGGLHPTQKPVAVPERAILHSSKSGDAVLDLFGGSGTTLIACEKAGRRCLMMELSPLYCDVIVKRWQKFTGKNATFECDTGMTFNEAKDGRDETRERTTEMATA